MRFDVITLFPEMFSALTNWGVTGRACEHKLTNVILWNPRDFCPDPRRAVDDRAYGGGPGMVMMVKPLEDTLSEIRSNHQKNGVQTGPVCLMAPQGERFSQKIATDILNYKNVIFHKNIIKPINKIIKLEKIIAVFYLILKFQIFNNSPGI